MRVVDVSFLNNIKGDFIILSIIIIVMIMLALYFVRKEIRSKKMKKIIKNLILLILLIPTIAKADMGAPYLGKLEAIVSNTDGAISKDNEKLDYGEKVLLHFTINYGDEAYYQVCLKSNESKCYEILVKDLSPLEYNLDDFKSESTIKMYAYKSTKMYSGPASYYEEIDGVEIPAGTVLTSNYYSELYMYVTYNGVSGWVYKYSYNLGNFNKDNTKCTLANFWESTEKVYTTKEVMLLDEPVDGQKTGKTIPKNTKLDIKYVFRHTSHYYYLYVEYNGNKGWILYDYNNLSIKYEESKQIYIVKDKLNVYDSASKDAKVIGTVNKNQEVNSKYVTGIANGGVGYHYIKNNEIEGWLYTEYDTVMISMEDVVESYNGDYRVYKSFTDDSEIVGNVKLNGKYKIKYRYYDSENSKTINYIENIDGISGWVSGQEVSYVKLNNTSNVYDKKGKVNKIVATIDKDTNIPYFDTYKDEEGNVWYQIISYNGISGWVLDKSIEPQLPTINKSKVETKKVETKEEIDKLYYILGGTIGLVIITGVTIVLINKNKKTKVKEKISISDDLKEIDNNDN